MLLSKVVEVTCILFGSAGVASALPSARSTFSCGDLIREANDNDGVAWAIDVYDCWTSVPFNPAVASRFVKYWNDTLQFQSTLDYLKSPPASYQQPAVDLIAGLNDIQDAINGGSFPNEYEFEAALQNLLYSANDAHLTLDAGILSSFTFGSIYDLTSLSLDGIALPKVYLTEDLLSNQTKPDESWQPSPISQINGTDVIDYLTRFAALNSHGTSEPHADWNLLFDSPVIDVLGESFPIWSGGATFYPGDTFTYTFENGTSLPDAFLGAYYNPYDTGPLETGGDYYNFFVLGLSPASYNDSESTSEDDTVSDTPDTSAPTSFNDYTDAYPEPDISQPNLTWTGFLTGYFLHDASLAVLSIPSFYADGVAIGEFADTVQEFLVQSKAAGMQKVVIDLQQNDGGDVLLAYSTFKSFFPSIEPFAASEMRAHPLADIMGTAITGYWQQNLTDNDWQFKSISSDEWIATTKLNPTTRQNFTSWSEFFDPYFDGVENVTSPQRLNTTNYLYDYSSLGQEEPPPVLLQPYAGNSPYAAEDIIMLSDGLCASACSVFMEMMHHDAAVKNVVVGGRPTYGPMQTPSGSRGARYYDLSELDADVANTIAIKQDFNEQVNDIPDRLNQNVFVFYGGLSIRSQVRKGETMPLAMQFEAADCRIFFTPSTFNNFTNLWRYAANAIWTSPELCVPGSTGYATTGSANSTSVLPAPAAPSLAAVGYSDRGIPALNNSEANVAFLISTEPMPDADPAKFLARPPPPSDRYGARVPLGSITASKEPGQVPSGPSTVERQRRLGSKPRCARGAPSCRSRRRRNVR